MEDDTYFRWIKVSIALIITVVILASNTINLMALYRMREIGVRMKVLLMSLSTSDLCLGLFVCMPAVVSGIMSRWPFGPVMCQITGTVNGIAISVSLWSLMAIGVERYVVMRRRSVSRSKNKSHVVGVCVAFIWTFNTLFFALPIAWEPDFLYYSYDPDVLTCSFMWKHTWHFLAAKFLYPILSGTIIVFTSWQVNQVLKKAERARKQWIINPVSRVGMKAEDHESKTKVHTKEYKKTSEQKQTKPSRCLMPVCGQGDTFQDLDQTRLSAPQSPLLMRNFEHQTLGDPPFTCSYIYRNRHACPLIKDNGRVQTHLTESNTDTNFENCGNNATGICSPPSGHGAKDTVSQLSESDLMVHLRTPTSSKSTDTSVEDGINEKGSEKQTENRPSLLNHIGSPSTNCSTFNAKTSFFSFNFDRKKKTWNKHAPVQDSMSLKSSSQRTGEQASNSLDAPMSKSFLRRQRKAKALLLCTTTVFFIAISPYSISSLLEHFIPDLGLPSWLRFLALWTLCTNCLLNVFIYSAVYAEFRGHCKRIFHTVTCRSKKVKDHIVSGQTSSVFELFAVKGKTENGSSAQNTENGYYGSTRNVDGVSTNSHNSSSFSAPKTPEICALSTSNFEEVNPQNRQANMQHLQLPPHNQSIKRARAKPAEPEFPNIIQISPATPVQQKLQPRDDVGMFSPYSLSSPRMVSGAPATAPTSCTSTHIISPSISQSTSCSLDSFNLDMMPSVDV
ncbi:cholecystokinin receptor [Elysia marginata]|uniref:Cholecystokinin receptor n=1 Tax=Elysia marginata TaxID=1093978 RepID=A0AAV4J9Y6_9GAST|nr:cholecystokinin receptor [Elysia marginata]